MEGFCGRFRGRFLRKVLRKVIPEGRRILRKALAEGFCGRFRGRFSAEGKKAGFEHKSSTNNYYTSLVLVLVLVLIM